ncbi:MAG TPA: hypothetical protein VHN15_06170, partial [Thermoanaerobaculia bacterium]|nr:hypothetical protein [Thermoanaerobaculia bacterium]
MRRPGLRAALLAAGLLVLPALTGPAAAQRGKNQEPAQEDSFFGSVDVNVVTVEVFVTDKDGKFVPGLTQADFEILEDGKPVEITNF